MSDAFDPYHKWLGIPPAEQPPNHYRLLGIATFESDGDVIDAAAEQRMTFLQNIAQGPQLEHSQRLLNEVAAARLCLLNAEKKASYDAGLQSAQTAVATDPDTPSAGDFDFLNAATATSQPVADGNATTVDFPDFPDFSGIAETDADAVPDFGGLTDSDGTDDVPDFSQFVEPSSDNEKPGINPEASTPAPPPVTPPANKPQPPPIAPPSMPAPAPSEAPDFSGVAETVVGEIPDFSAASASPAPPVVTPQAAPPPQPAGEEGAGDESGSFLDKIKQLPTWSLMVGGSSIAAILALVIVLLVRGKSERKELIKANQAKLIIDWPLDERDGAYLEIDDEEKKIDDTRELEFRLKAGEKHRIRIEREGFRTISQTVPFEKGQIKRLKLNWKRDGG